MSNYAVCVGAAAVAATSGIAMRATIQSAAQDAFTNACGKPGHSSDCINGQAATNIVVVLCGIQFLQVVLSMLSRSVVFTSAACATRQVCYILALSFFAFMGTTPGGSMAHPAVGAIACLLFCTAATLVAYAHGSSCEKGTAAEVVLETSANALQGAFVCHMAVLSLMPITVMVVGITAAVVISIVLNALAVVYFCDVMWGGGQCDDIAALAFLTCAAIINAYAITL